MTVRAFAALFVALICSLLVHRAHAVIFASDDFSSPTSGTGWAPGNSWEGLDGGIVTTNPDGNSNVQSFRDFATPLDATNQTTYLRFDYAQTVPGDGNSYGGVSFFEGVEGSAGFEAFFAGNASG